jgi:cytoskeleton protein RodZ
MSEPVGQGVSEEVALNPAPDVAAAAVQAGHLLRTAREATGLHVAALAVALKVPVKKLEALEAGHLDLLPDVTFARALAASVCRTLKIDPGTVLAYLPATGASRLGADVPAINTPYRPAGPRLSFRGQMLNPSVLAVVALLVAAAVVVLWPQSPDDVAVLAAPVEEATTPVVAAPQAEVSGPVAVSPVEPPVIPVETVAVSALVTQEAMQSSVVLTAQAESWVRVTDAKGVVNLGRTLKAGESVAVTGAFPMAVIVGRVDAVQLQVRGQPYDMAAFPKDRVARFEVK